MENHPASYNHIIRRMKTLRFFIDLIASRGLIGLLFIFVGPNREDNSRLKKCANIFKKASNSSKHKQLLEEAQAQAQIQVQASAQAQHIEDSGHLQELWLEEFKRIGTLLLMAEKRSSICSSHKLSIE